MSWREVVFGDAFKVKHGFAFKSEYFGESGQYVVLTPGNFYEHGGFRLRPSKERYYTLEPPEDFILKPGDVVVAMTEQGEGLLGSCAIIPDEGDFLHNQRIGLIQDLDEKKIERGYLYWLFNSRPVRAQIRATASGTKVRHTAPDRIGSVKVQVPQAPDQKRISGILFAYDDLIENNRRRIALLEEAARVLYREWFVYFRFPGHEHVKLVDGLPEGWKPRLMENLVDVVREQVRPANFAADDIHIGLEHIPRRSFTLSEWEPANGLASPKTRFLEGDILFCKIRPYFHKVGFAIRSGLASSDAIVWRVKDRDDWTLVVCASSSDQFVAVASKTVREGSKMPRADWNVLKRYVIPKPPDHLLRTFNDVVEPITAQCKSLALQNRALSSARDLLLPRLMSGEIAV